MFFRHIDELLGVLVYPFQNTESLTLSFMWVFFFFLFSFFLSFSSSSFFFQSLVEHSVELQRSPCAGSDSGISTLCPFKMSPSIIFNG